MRTARAKRAPEELVLYALFVVIGAIPIAVELVHGPAFPGELAIGMLMVCAGLVGLLVRR